MGQLATQPAASGGLTILKLMPAPHILAANEGSLIRDDLNGHFYKTRERHLPHNIKVSTWQKDFLSWLRDHVDKDIPRAFYKAVLGHDLHVSTYADLFAKHFHADLRDPFTGELGWLENLGRVSEAKVCTAFCNFEALMLVTDATTIGDYKYHETGTSSQAEAASDTALITTAISGSLAARVAGTQVNNSSITYTSVATLTATGTATWQEHGLFNAASGVTLMDRSVISPSVAVVNADTVQFTYTLTKTAEA